MISASHFIITYNNTKKLVRYVNVSLNTQVISETIYPVNPRWVQKPVLPSTYMAAISKQIKQQPSDNKSNVATVTKVQSASAHLFAGTWRPWVSVITTLYYVVISYHLVRGTPHSVMLLCCH